MYHQLAHLLIGQARQLYHEDAEVASVFAIDSTTIDLCLSLFPWAEFRQRKAAIKLHTVMDLEGSIPTFIHISDARTHDVNVLNIIPIVAGSIYILDRGYIDFERLYSIHQAGGKFVIRARKNLQF